MTSGGVPGGVGTTIRMALEGNDSAWAGAGEPQPASPKAKTDINAVDHFILPEPPLTITCSMVWSPVLRNRHIPPFLLLAPDFREAIQTACIPSLGLLESEVGAKHSVFLRDLGPLGGVCGDLRVPTDCETPRKQSGDQGETQNRCGPRKRNSLTGNACSVLVIARSQTACRDESLPENHIVDKLDFLSPL
ncbi:hypothetical protein [Bradyrhizobium sp. sBnM-33]|uniref:hypothetical protein n=1 Tax=Bradyrhizobium sp. sBnM-33 TaxID=2831780 RepID=UPI001BD017FC|nr:hypothetical protein [Bradyrhizobium sp. sBnM-33]WOH48281.1 hypothetical protein RX328_29695 [Bradyrhizobium sp. sBnM-33]